jgi:hypothetical protein
MCYTHIGDKVYNTTILVTKTNDNKYELGGKNGNTLKNIYISNNFSSDDRLTVLFKDSEIVNKPYITTIAKDSSGEIKKFCLADLVNKIEQLQKIHQGG